MTKIRNALAAGAVMASALVVPAAMSTSFAAADTLAMTTPTTLTFLLKPCSEHKNPDRCRARRELRREYRRELGLTCKSDRRREYRRELRRAYKRELGLTCASNRKREY
ncbi:hypothetical protein, partial [Streptosporangium oxazolinicum]|uniref:hypothetical protein n=1 Tax=Streptosporangium oxazolinicum TaxID=909287 RepID=UPI0031E64DA0